MSILVTARHERITFPPGDILTITFDDFSVEIVFEGQQRLTVSVTKGENTGFKDTTSYEASKLPADLFKLSWQETIGTTVIHVVDAAQATTMSFVTPTDGGFLRLRGRVDLGRLMLKR